VYCDDVLSLFLGGNPPVRGVGFVMIQPLMPQAPNPKHPSHLTVLLVYISTSLNNSARPFVIKRYKLKVNILILKVGAFSSVCVYGSVVVRCTEANWDD
jgi:hypothetical protein